MFFCCFIIYSPWKQPSVSHAESEGGTKNPMSHVNKANGPYQGCKITQHDLSGILDCKGPFFNYVRVFLTLFEPCTYPDKEK